MKTNINIGDVIFDFPDNHKFTITEIKNTGGEIEIIATCCQGDIIKFKEEDRTVYREVSD